MKYFVDIDGTICHTFMNHYYGSSPRFERIAHINRLYDEGHHIVYWTARGMSTHKDWRELTENQLSMWGCKYHELLMGKPAYDVFIDDKSVHPDEFFPAQGHFSRIGIAAAVLKTEGVEIPV